MSFIITQDKNSYTLECLLTFATRECAAYYAEEILKLGEYGIKELNEHTCTHHD